MIPMVMIKVFRHLCRSRCDRRDEAEAGDARDREARGGIQVREPGGLLLGGEELDIHGTYDLN